MSAYDNARRLLGDNQIDRSAEFLRAAEVGDALRVMALVEAGVDINTVNEYGQTAYFLATWRRHSTVLHCLKRFGASTDLADAAGVLPAWIHHDDDNNNDGLEQRLRWPPCMDNIMSMGVSNVHVASKPPRVTICIPFEEESAHVGAGSFYVDDAFTDAFLDQLLAICAALPRARACANKQKEKNHRSYYCDVFGWIQAVVASVVAKVKLACASHDDNNIPIPGFNPSLQGKVFAQMRFLIYDATGAGLPPHNDLAKTDLVSGQRSSHTFCLYLMDCEAGGETVLLDSMTTRTPPHSDMALNKPRAVVQPKRGRLLCFPHACPHEARSTVSIPKVLLRGEMY